MHRQARTAVRVHRFVPSLTGLRLMLGVVIVSLKMTSLRPWAYYADVLAQTAEVT